LQMNFQLACGDCKKGGGAKIVNGPMRELFASAMKLSPVRFAESTSNETKEIAEISEILRRIFSDAIGREVATGKSLVRGI
ncbi:MAG: hypothetical protein ACRD43_13615, partial [Pyrinomonadaceae bacterium]